MTTPVISIGFFLLAALLGALGQYLYKMINTGGMAFLVLGMFLMGK